MFFNADRAVCREPFFSVNALPQAVSNAQVWVDKAKPSGTRAKDVPQVLEKRIADLMMMETGNLLRWGAVQLRLRIGPPDHSGKSPSLLYDEVETHWRLAMGLDGTKQSAPPPWPWPPTAGLPAKGQHGLTELQEATAALWFMLDRDLGDSVRDGIGNQQGRLAKTDQAYAPFGKRFPMMLLIDLFSQFPRGLFSALFLEDAVLLQGAEAAGQAADKRLRETFQGVFEPDLQLTLETCYSREVFASTDEQHRGRPLKVLSPGLLAAADLFIRASVCGQTLTQKFGKPGEIAAQHMEREKFFAKHWKAFGDVWKSFYVDRATAMCAARAQQSGNAGSARAQDSGNAGSALASGGGEFIGACQHAILQSNMHVMSIQCMSVPQHACKVNEHAIHW